MHCTGCTYMMGEYRRWFGGWVGEGTSMVLRIEKRAEHPPTRQPRPLGGSWSMIQHTQDFTLSWSEYGKCLHLEMMTLDPVSKRRLFTLLKWNKVWLPAGSKMIQNLWFNVMMCTIIHISILHPTFGTMVEAAWIRLNHGRHLFRCSTFSISRWRFSPGFYASVSFMIPCSIYFFFHSTDATYSNRSTFWSNLVTRSVLFFFPALAHI